MALLSDFLDHKARHKPSGGDPLFPLDFSLLPKSDNAYDLGSSGYRFKSLYIYTIYGSPAYILQIYGNLISTDNNTWMLGSATKKWRKLFLGVHTDGCSLVADGLIRVCGALPLINDSYDLGDYDYRWRELWLSRDAHINGDIFLDGILTLASPLYFNLNEAKGIVLEKLTSDPTGADLAEGRTWLRTDLDRISYSPDGAAVKRVPRNLDDVENVLISAPADKEVLTYESATAKWKNKTPAAGVLVSRSYAYATGLLTLGSGITDVLTLNFTKQQAGTVLMVMGNLFFQHIPDAAETNLGVMVRITMDGSDAAWTSFQVVSASAGVLTTFQVPAIMTKFWTGLGAGSHTAILQVYRLSSTTRVGIRSLTVDESS